MVERDETERKVLAGDDALDLWRKGKDCWNAWADNPDNEGCCVDFSGVLFKAENDEDVNFVGYRFPGDAEFQGASFGGNANFKDAKFGGRASFGTAKFDGVAIFAEAMFYSFADFEQATFGGYAYFQYAKFDFDADFLIAIFGGEAGFKGAKFSGYAFFREAVFRGLANFEEAKFSGVADFMGAKFDSNASFESAEFTNDGKFVSVEFDGYTDFTGCKFTSRAGFDYTNFGDDADFSGTTFDGAISFTGSIFHNVPDLRQTITKAHITLYEMRVEYEKERNWIAFRQATDHEAADKFRRLKQLAIEAKDHQRELVFLANEFRTERFHDTTGIRLIPNYLYAWTSDFGQSIQRPFWYLVTLWLLVAQILLRDGSIFAPPYSRAADALLVSAGNLLPFIGGSRAAIARKDRLFPKTEFPDGIPAWVDAVSIIEGLLAAVFIFLIGLALRNRFRL